MTFKFIPALGLGLYSIAGFAGTIASCPALPVAADLVNRCTPEVTFYMGGASSQAPAIIQALTTPGFIFDESRPFVKVRDVALSLSGSGSYTTALPPGVDGNTIAFIGYGAFGTGAAAGKRVAIIYNQANGSFAAVKQMLKPKDPLEENITLQLTSRDEQKAGTGKGATACPPSSVVTDEVLAQTGFRLGYKTFLCDTEVPFSLGWGGDKQKTMSLALTDMRPSEAVPDVVTKWSNKTFPAVTTAMQGFGVIVSPALYTQLIAKEVANGNLPASCLTSETVGSGSTDTVHAFCQPNLPTADYTGLVTGSVTTANAFLGTSGDSSKIILARLADISGTQAASNIFFAGQENTAAKKAKRASDAAPTVAAGVPGTPGLSKAYGDLNVFEKNTADEVIAAVSGAAFGSYGIGVVSLLNRYDTVKAHSDLKGALYVKLGGISPNMVEIAGTTVVDTTARDAIMAGYPMTYAMQAITSAKLAGPYATLAAKLIAELQNPVADLPGIANIGSSNTARNTPFVRANGNYAPLSR
jgi:hypothetical protein